MSVGGAGVWNSESGLEEAKSSVRELDVVLSVET